MKFIDEDGVEKNGKDGCLIVEVTTQIT